MFLDRLQSRPAAGCVIVHQHDLFSLGVIMLAYCIL